VQHVDRSVVQTRQGHAVLEGPQGVIGDIDGRQDVVNRGRICPVLDDKQEARQLLGEHLGDIGGEGRSRLLIR